jgi:hypothetical protein
MIAFFVTEKAVGIAFAMSKVAVIRILVAFLLQKVRANFGLPCRTLHTIWLTLEIFTLFVGMLQIRRINIVISKKFLIALDHPKGN